MHEKFSLADVRNVRRPFPDAIVLAHPECRPEVVEAADFSGSTTAMMIRLCSVRCPHMNEISLEQTRLSLLEERQVIDIDEDTRRHSCATSRSPAPRNVVRRLLQKGACPREAP